MPDSSASPVSTPSTARGPVYNITDEFVSRPAREHPEKLAILGTGRARTYADLESLVNRLAGFGGVDRGVFWRGEDWCDRCTGESDGACSGLPSLAGKLRGAHCDCARSDPG